MEQRRSNILILVIMLAGFGVTWGIQGYTMMSLTPEYTYISVGGSTSCLPFVTKAAEEYERLYTSVRIDIVGGGSSKGIVYAGEGTKDIGMSSKPMGGLGDISKLETYPNLKAYYIALDGVAIAVNDVWVNGFNLTEADIKLIFEADSSLDTWGELETAYGLTLPTGIIASDPIITVGRDTDSGTRECFHKYFGYSTETGFTYSGGEYSSNGGVLTKISTTEGAIGYLSFGYIDEEGVSAVGVSKDISPTVFVQPTAAGIYSSIDDPNADESYPIWRWLQVLTSGTKQGVPGQFIDFIRGTGQAYAFEIGVVPLPPTFTDPHESGGVWGL